MRLSSLEAHRLWAPTYDSQPNPLLALETRVLHSLLPAMPARVVDIACGTGRWMRHFRRLGCAVYGLDACPEMLFQARSAKSLDGLLIQARAERLPFGSCSADLVLCSFGISYFENPVEALAEMARVASPGATVALSDFHPSAEAAGWKRSFRVGERCYEAEHRVISAANLDYVARACGLRLITSLDARFSASEKPIFEKASKLHLFPQLSRIPAIWVGIWTKV